MRRLPRTLLPVGAALAVVLTTTACTDGAPARALTARPSATPTATRVVVPDARCTGGARTAVATALANGKAVEALPGTSLAGKAAGIGTTAVVLGAATYRTADFVAGKDRVDSVRIPQRSVGIVGQGVDTSSVALVKHSSTRKKRVPTKEYVVNPLNVLRVSSTHAVVGGFTLAGSAQGHTFNGLRIERSTNARVADLRVTGIRGSMTRPPGETFGINDYRTVGSRYSHVEIDGAKVGAAGFGANVSKDVTICDSSSHDNRVSMGFAFWDVRNVTLVDDRAWNNGYTAFNFERVSGTVQLIRPVAKHNRWDMRVASDRGSAKYTIVDPDLRHTKVKGKWTVALPSIYYGKKSKQKRSDITLIVHGKKRPDLLRLVKQY